MSERDGDPLVRPVPLGFVKAFLVRGERIILVDTGMAGSVPRIARAMQRLGAELADLALVVLTHAHADHAGSARELSSLVSCPIMIHEGDAPALRSGEYPIGEPVGRMMRGLFRIARARARRGAPRAPRAPGVEPALVIDGPVSLAPWGIDATVESTPGHTPGSVSIFLAGGEAIVGDLVRGSLASAGVPRWPFLAADIEEDRRSLERVLARRPTLIWTSHGGPLTAERCARSLLAGPLPA